MDPKSGWRCVQTLCNRRALVWRSRISGARADQESDVGPNPQSVVDVAGASDVLRTPNLEAVAGSTSGLLAHFSDPLDQPSVGPPWSRVGPRLGALAVSEIRLKMAVEGPTLCEM